MVTKDSTKVSKSFTMPNLRTLDFTIDFNGSLDDLCGAITH